MNLDDERLKNLSIEELEALANSILMTKNQMQLNDLLDKNANNQITIEDSLYYQPIEIILEGQ